MTPQERFEEIERNMAENRTWSFMAGFVYGTAFGVILCTAAYFIITA